MNQLVGRERLDVAQKLEIVLLMLEDVEQQEDVEFRIPLLGHVRQAALQSFVLTSPTELDRLGRDVIAHEQAVRFHPLLELVKHFACATTDLADTSR